MNQSNNSFETRTQLRLGDKTYQYFDLRALRNDPDCRDFNLDLLPYSLKILLENLLRCEDGASVMREHILAVTACAGGQTPEQESAFRPARVLMQDFTGVPGVV